VLVIVAVFVIFIFDVFILRGVGSVIWKMLFPYGIFYFGFCALLGLRGARTFYRLNEISNVSDKSDPVILEKAELDRQRYYMLSVCSALILFFLLVISYASAIYPFIPTSRGGADFTGAPRVSAVLSEGAPRGSDDLSEQTTDSILIYATSTSFFFAKPLPGNGPCEWRSHRAAPRIVQIQRDIVPYIRIPSSFSIPENCK
jgi:hypothetical protein